MFPPLKDSAHEVMKYLYEKYRNGQILPPEVIQNIACDLGLNDESDTGDSIQYWLNVAKHLRSKRLIEMREISERGYALVSISDNGIVDFEENKNTIHQTAQQEQDAEPSKMPKEDRYLSEFVSLKKVTEDCRISYFMLKKYMKENPNCYKEIGRKYQFDLNDPTFKSLL